MEKLPEQYLEMKKENFSGFQTWNVRSILSHVDMETGFAVNICLKDAAMGNYLKETLIGRFGREDELVVPEAHAWDGSYTSVKVSYNNIVFRVQSCKSGEYPLVLLVTPLGKEELEVREDPWRDDYNQAFQERCPSMLVLESGMLWNREGVLRRVGDTLTASTPLKEYVVYSNGKHEDYDGNIPTQTPYLAARFEKTIVYSVNKELSVPEAQKLMEEAEKEYRADIDRFAPFQEDYEAIVSVMNWDTTYDARNDRIVTPVSRLWSIGHGGYIIFCWDNFFASFMASLKDKFISYSNIIEIAMAHTEQGFVPNHTDGTGMKTGDRSQPPVGSTMLCEVYRRYKDRWLVEFLYPLLFRWNTWYYNNRMEENGVFCWGSNHYTPVVENYWEVHGIGELYGCKMESGLDNSPMYDDMPVKKVDDIVTRMALADVGLTGLFIMDTRSLIRLAKLLGREEDIQILKMRQEKAEQGLESLWDDEFGFYCNRRTDTGAFEYRISPTNFYALFSTTVSAEHKARIMEHYYDPVEFYGEWMLPAIARNDPAFSDQQYWRGRVWAPMNFLVYIALRDHPDLEKMRMDLVEKSEHILMKEWREHRHVHENYNSITGEGCDSRSSDKFYHWGALLGVIHMIENGLVPGFGKELD